MSPGFLIIGGIIFAVYIYFTFWNIFYGHKKQKEENYPDLKKKDIIEEYREANDIDDDSIL